ncbi:hypothetical protein N7510_005944 [Penicillium lagena]|uniref:uncharacterized protein n=1 Tax=Penicillium lagena TaxID=94218 RepID=UPI00253FF2FC|nr:uncharacterized protein N7510_005944 [Penicillium lagena]KAJ5612750.1 hypothetical protein N7510_005944 [Penicillium lagena]
MESTTSSILSDIIGVHLPEMGSIYCFGKSQAGAGILRPCERPLGKARIVRAREILGQSLTCLQRDGDSYIKELADLLIHHGHVYDAKSTMTTIWNAKVEHHQSQLGDPSEYICTRSPQVNSCSGARRSDDIVEDLEFQASSRAPTIISSISIVHEEASNVNPDRRGPYIEYDRLTEEEAVEEPMQLPISEVPNIECHSLVGIRERVESEFEAVTEHTTNSCLSGSSTILVCICSLLQIKVDNTQVHDDAGHASKQTVVEFKFQMDLLYSLRDRVAIMAPWLIMVVMLFVQLSCLLF